MRVVVETPKGSFTKYRLVDNAFKPELRTPFPSFFNYGFMEGETSGDGLPRDVIVLGPRLEQGSRVECREVGVVLFWDAGVEDSKVVGVVEGGISFWDRVRIHVFFVSYMLFKSLRYLLVEGKVACSWYGGLNVEE
jgi:inorganic pyrophosphatase